MIERIRAWFRKQHTAADEKRLRSTRRALEDACYDKEKWSFADSPSQREDRNERIHALIRSYEELGGDALKTVPYGLRYMVAEAMPVSEENSPGL